MTHNSIYTAAYDIQGLRVAAHHQVFDRYMVCSKLFDLIVIDEFRSRTVATCQPYAWLFITRVMNLSGSLII
jgi:hypothetical protein